MVKVKICGLMDQFTVEAACDMGADFLGFVFAKSKRQVTPEAVAAMTINVPKRVKKVGVFVSPKIEEVKETIDIAKLDLVQIHQVIPAGRLPVPLIAAQNGETSDGTLPFGADYLLLDAPSQDFAGGNGKTFDWQALDVSTLPQKQLMVAGGLQVNNVASVIDHFQPIAVDVSSGVEINGIKDLEKIKAFIERVKGR